MTVYPKVSGLAAWSENCKWYSCHLVQLHRYFVSQSNEFCRHNPLCCFSTNVCYCCFVIDSVRKLLDTPSYMNRRLQRCGFRMLCIPLHFVLAHLPQIKFPCSLRQHNSQGKISFLSLGTAPNHQILMKQGRCIYYGRMHIMRHFPNFHTNRTLLRGLRR
jgi:hypothetical protein